MSFFSMLILMLFFSFEYFETLMWVQKSRSQYTQEKCHVSFWLSPSVPVPCVLFTLPFFCVSGLFIPSFSALCTYVFALGRVCSLMCPVSISLYRLFPLQPPCCGSPGPVRLFLWHLGCFQHFAITNSAVMSNRVCTYFRLVRGTPSG